MGARSKLHTIPDWLRRDGAAVWSGPQELAARQDNVDEIIPLLGRIPVGRITERTILRTIALAPELAATVLRSQLPPHLEYTSASSRFTVVHPIDSDKVLKIHRRSVWEDEAEKRVIKRDLVDAQARLQKYIGNFLLPQDIDLVRHPFFKPLSGVRPKAVVAEQPWLPHAVDANLFNSQTGALNTTRLETFKKDTAMSRQLYEFGLGLDCFHHDSDDSELGDTTAMHALQFAPTVDGPKLWMTTLTTPSASPDDVRRVAESNRALLANLDS